MMPGFTIIRDTTPAAAIPKGAVVAMGNFDGVHLGHRAVIAAALQMGRAPRPPAVAGVSSRAASAQFFQPEQPPVPAYRRDRKAAPAGRNRARRRRRHDL